MLLSIKQHSQQEDLPIYGSISPSDTGLMPGNGIYTKPPGSLMIQLPSQPPAGNPHLEISRCQLIPDDLAQHD